MKLKIALCLCLLALSQAFADDKPQMKIDPAAAAAATAIGAVGGPVVSVLTGGLLNPSQAADVVSNAAVVLDSTAKAVANKVGAVGALTGGLIGGKGQILGGLTAAHGQAGKALVDLVTAANSLSIATTDAFAGAASNVIGGIVGKIRGEALTVGKIYSQLLNEFGRAVGNGLKVMDTLTGPLKPLHPLAIGLDALEFHLNALIQFLKGAVDITVADPKKAAMVAPFIGTLEAVKKLLEALDAAFVGPTGGVLSALDGAVNVAADLANVATGAAGAAIDAAATGGNVAGAVADAVTGLGLGSFTNLAGLVQTGLNLLNQLV